MTARDFLAGETRAHLHMLAAIAETASPRAHHARMLATAAWARRNGWLLSARCTLTTARNARIYGVL